MIADYDQVCALNNAISINVCGWVPLWIAGPGEQSITYNYHVAACNEAVSIDVTWQTIACSNDYVKTETRYTDYVARHR